jgi:hypothetical protein
MGNTRREIDNARFSNREVFRVLSFHESTEILAEEPDERDVQYTARPIHSIACSSARPSVQFVNRFDRECVRRLQRACNPDFPAEKCLHATNISQYVRVRA